MSAVPTPVNDDSHRCTLACAASSSRLTLAVNHVTHREPAAPALRATSRLRARRARTRRGRGRCASAYGLRRRRRTRRRACRESNPRAWTTTSIGRRVAGLLHRRPSASAPCRTARPSWRVVRLVNPRARHRRRPRTGAPPPRRRARKTCMPSEKFAAASTPMPALRRDALARRPRAPASRSCRSRRSMPRAATAPRFACTASGSEKSIATSTVAEVAPAIAGSARSRPSRCRRSRSRARPASRSTSWPMRPWPISRIRMRRSVHAARDAVSPERTARARASSAGSRSASRITSVMFRRAAACDTIRIGTPPSASSSWLTNVGSLCRPSPTAQRSPSRPRASRRPPRRAPPMISGSRRASSTVTETLTSDVVTTSTDVRCCSNTSKMRLQEPVRHQHARRRDVDDGHALLRRDRRQRPVRWPGARA